MFVNFKVIAKMRSPVATIGPLILDSIISAAVAKDILQDDYYQTNNVAGDYEIIRGHLDKILDRNFGVYCTSVGYADAREVVGTWVKRWSQEHTDLINFKGKGKKRVDTGGGFYKNYHMPIITKSTDEITFYVRGDIKEVERLLTSYISYLGKKSSQGYGQVLKWEFKEIKEDKSIWKDNKPSRPIPVKYCEEYIEMMMQKGEYIDTKEHPIIPPYWREDHRELCIVVEGM